MRLIKSSVDSIDDVDKTWGLIRIIKLELYKKGETEPFTDPIEKEFPSRSPKVTF